MQETPVTQEQYLAVRGVNPAYPLRPYPALSKMYHGVDAVLFCNSLSQALQNLDTCYSYTAIWRYRCRSAILPKKDIAFPQKRNGNMPAARYDTTYWWGADTVGMGARVFTPNYGDVSDDGIGCDEIAERFRPFMISLETAGNGVTTGKARLIMRQALHPTRKAQQQDQPESCVVGRSLGAFLFLADYYKSAFRANMKSHGDQ